MSEVTLHLGDCLEYMKTMEAGSVDAVITDPPYGANKFHGDNKKAIRQEIVKWSIFSDYAINSFMTFCDYRTLRLWMNIYRKLDLLNILLWHKELGGSSARYFPRKTEYILWYAKKKDYVFNPPMVDAKSNRLSGFKKKMTDLIDIPSINNMSIERNGHPTQKPIKLMRLLIESISNVGDTIFDPFMGSGTTGVACVQTGRNFIGCEIDPNYFAIAEKRIKEAQMQLRLGI